MVVDCDGVAAAVVPQIVVINAKTKTNINNCL